MTFKDQWKKIKENWLIVLAFLVLFLFTLFPATETLQQQIGMKAAYDSSYAMEESAVARGMIAPSPGYYGEFAPEVEERKITKSASISNEVKRGEFKESEERLKSIVTSTDSILLYENTQKYGKGRTSYYTGYYTLKVEAGKYNAVLSPLKQIGEVTSFSESQDDITGQYNNLQINLEVEKERLKRYKEMFSEAKDVSDKIELNDRIFNQERTVKYLEDALKNVGQQVEYSTISVTLTEKQSGYAGVALVKLSELVKKFVGSVNSLLSLLFLAIPYAVAALVIWLGYKLVRKRK